MIYPIDSHSISHEILTTKAMIYIPIKSPVTSIKSPSTHQEITIVNPLTCINFWNGDLMVINPLH